MSDISFSFEYKGSKDDAFSQIKNMEQKAREKYPQYAEDMDEYLSGPSFRGFNCFVMKRDLFFELCEYEFDVLSQLEKAVDFGTYDFTRARVYGFMAEIISSSFIYHVAKRGRARVRDVQMLYFDNTDPIVDIPATAGGGAGIAVLAVTLQSFLDSLDGSRRYDLVVVHDKKLPAFYRKEFVKLFDAYPKVELSFINWSVKSRAFEDMAGENRKALQSALLCLLPWILPNHSRLLVFGERRCVKCGCEND